MTTNSGSNVTLNAGKGDDIIQSGGSSNVYVYNNGDGTDIIQGLSGTNRLMLNGEIVSLTTGENATLTINGGDSDSSAPTLNVSGNVTVNSMTNQTWEVEEGETLTYGSGSSAISLAPENTTAIITSDTYLSASVNVEGGAMAFAGSSKDTVSFNDKVLGGVVGTKATVTSVNETLATVQVTDSASLNAGTIGGAAYLAAGATATITGAPSVAVISAVDSLASVGGSWTLGSNQTTAQLGNDTVIFAEADNGNLIWGREKVIGIYYPRVSANNVTLMGVGDHSYIDPYRANSLSAFNLYWELYTEDSFKAVFDNSTNATISDFDTNENSTLIAYLKRFMSSDGNRTLAIGSNDIVKLKFNRAATIEGGLVKNVEALDGNWTVRGGSGERAVTLGSNVITFEKPDSNNIYGVIIKDNSNIYSQVNFLGLSSLSGNVTVKGGTGSNLNIMNNTGTASGAVGFVYDFDITSSSANVTLNGVPVNIRVSNSSLSHPVLYGSEDDVVSTIKGVRLNDTIGSTVDSDKQRHN